MRRLATFALGVLLGASLFRPALGVQTHGDPQACIDLRSLVLTQYDRAYAAEMLLYRALSFERVRREPTASAFVKLMRVDGTWRRMNLLSLACTGEES